MDNDQKFSGRLAGNCKSCLYARNHPNDEKIYCHRYPPQLVAMGRENPITRVIEAGILGMFPDVPKNMSCGEWTPCFPKQ